MLISKIAKLVDEARTEKGIMICNINPFMVTAAILNFGVSVKATFPLTKHRIEKYEDDLREAVGDLLDNCYEPYLIEKLLNQKDIDGFSPLYIFSQHKYYSIMKTDVADRIIMNKWDSKVDTSGSILENSIPYNMLTFYSTSYKDDFEEKKLRFYHKRNLFDDVRPHRCTFRVWFQSMSLRYRMEMVFFAIAVFAFQWYISYFVEGLHLVECHLSQVDAHYSVLNLDDTNGICPSAPTPADGSASGPGDASRLLEPLEEPSCCLTLNDSEFGKT